MRTLLIWLVVACLLPGIIGAAAVLRHEYHEGRAQLVENTSLTARALVQAVDNEILRTQALAQALATADSLARGDLARFHVRARQAIEQTALGTVAMLVDADGQQLVNTGKEFGDPLPRHGNPEIIRRVFETGKPVVSDLFISAVFRRPVMNVAVPVIHDGKVTYAINISVLPQRFDVILKAQGLPSGWVATVLDGANTIVSRSRESEKYAGEKPSPEFLQRRGASGEGALEFVMKDGVSVLSVFTRSQLTDWSVAINIPLDVLEAQLAHRFAMLSLSVAALFVIGLGLAWFVGGKIARSFQALRAPALALGIGEAVALPAVDVKEAAEVTKAMGEAAALLKERATALAAKKVELAKRTAALRQSEYRLVTLTEHAPAAIAIFDRDMRYLAVSRRWCQDFRLEEDGLIGKSHYEIFPDIPAQWKDAHRRGLAGEVLCSESDCLERSDGSKQWIHWELWPWYDDTGSVGGIVIACEDVTRRKEAERLVQVSEEKYRTLFSNMTEGFALGEAVLDKHGNPVDFCFLEANDAFFAETGLTPEILGRPVRSYMPRLEQSWIDAYTGVALTGQPIRFENFNADTQRHYDVYAFCPIPGRFAMLGRDVTRQKSVEAALQKSETYLWQLISTLPGMVWTAKTDGDWDFVSQQWLDYTGTTLISQLGTGFLASIHPADRESLAALWQRSLASQTDFDMEYRLRRHDGTYRWFKSRGAPLMERDGRISRWLGIIIDIDEQKRANEALQESEARFRLMADYAPAMIWLAGTDRACHWFNQPWLAFTGRSMQQECGNGWVEGVHPEDIEPCLRTYEEAFERHESFAMEYRLRRHDGEYRWVADQGAPRFEADGRFAGYVGACSDITERKLAQEAIERINIELESRVTERTAELLAANRELEGFTFAASHDLRGPLGRINSFSALLEQQYRDRLDGNGLVFLDFIRQNAERLTQLVDDLLSHARVVQQSLELQLVDVLALAQAVLDEKAEEIRERGATVKLRLPATDVRGDPHAITQALNNLVSNALKYSASSHPPVIEIGGKVTDGRFQFWIKDNGIGFDMAYHDKIFEIFRRLHTYSEYEGNGVGLALVKRAVERIGGRVWAESKPGLGATFFVELQAAEEAEM